MRTTRESPLSATPRPIRNDRHCLICGTTLHNAEDTLECGEKRYCSACYLESCFPDCSSCRPYMQERNVI
jgi:hypothetical protein